jgi:hypothetical protein
MPVMQRVAGGGAWFTAAELAEIRRAWEDAGRPPAAERRGRRSLPCAAAGVHRTEVVLADDTTVRGVTFMGDDPYGRETVPSFGLYLDERWQPSWPHAHVDWPDFGVPSDIVVLTAALQDLLDRARREERVEIGCLGGHGRTGTALACLAILAGTPASDAVEWVRANYCQRAIETSEQEAFVGAFGG